MSVLTQNLCSASSIITDGPEIRLKLMMTGNARSIHPDARPVLTMTLALGGIEPFKQLSVAYIREEAQTSI